MLLVPISIWHILLIIKFCAVLRIDCAFAAAFNNSSKVAEFTNPILEFCSLLIDLHNGAFQITALESQEP